MDNYFGKGIPLSSGFDLGAKLPLDSRIVVNTIEERDAHVSQNRAFPGLIVFVIETNELYKYDGSKWAIIPDKEYVDKIVQDIDPSQFDFVTKEELESMDIQNGSCSYVGDYDPGKDVIWFQPTSSNQNTFTYDNPLISELFACMHTLQEQVQKLQEDVEYLKSVISSGGGWTPDVDPDEPGEDTIFHLALEDGGLLTLEDGGLILLEYVEKVGEIILALEDGSSLTLEDGGLILLEESVRVIGNSLILLENGAQLLLENGANLLNE